MSKCNFFTGCEAITGNICDGKLFLFKDLPAEEQISLKWYSEQWDMLDNTFICEQHLSKFLMPITTRERTEKDKCCNPFGKHKKDIVSKFRGVSAEAAKRARKHNYELTEESKCCSNCCEALMILSSENTPENSQNSDNLSENLSPFVMRVEGDHELRNFGLSPIKNPPYLNSARQQYAKRKIEDISQVAGSASKKVCEALNVSEKSTSPEGVQKAEDLDFNYGSYSKDSANLRQKEEDNGLDSLSTLMVHYLRR